MNKKKYSYTPILWGLILLMFFYALHKKTKYDSEIATKNKLLEEMSKDESFYKMNFDLNFILTGIKVPSIECVDSNRNTTPIYSFAKKKSVLIYRYSDINCNTCYESELKTLHDLFLEKTDKVIILCSYKIERDFIIFKKMNHLRLPIYRISHDSLKLPSIYYSNPYYFVLNPDQKITNVYVPDPTYPELNKAYLESVKRLIN